MKICLNMIVKNETAILAECLESVRPWITSYVICDTGSTDGTPELIQSFGERHGLSGEIHTIGFQDFSQSRNLALAKARASVLDFDYLLLIDADMRLVSNGNDPEALDPQVDGYLLEQRSQDLSYWNLRLLRRSAAADYHGSTHEALHLDGRTDRLASAWMQDLANGSNRVHKLKRDIELLRKDLKKNPNDPRSTFYLAQTLKDSGDHAQALRHYQARAKMPGWDQENWYAAYMAGRCLLSLNRLPEASQRLLEAYAQRPQRLEPLYHLARAYRERGQHELAWVFIQMGLGRPAPPSEEILFVETPVYQWGFREEASISGYYLRNLEAQRLGQTHCKLLAADPGVPQHVQALARSNLGYYQAGHQAVLTAAKAD